MLFRALTNEQTADLKRGEAVIARDPKANASIEDHVWHNVPKSQFISASKCLYALFTGMAGNKEERDAAVTGSAIVKIDEELAKEAGCQIIDISDGSGISSPTPQNWAKSSKEVLIVGAIPAAACTILVEEGTIPEIYKHVSNQDWKEYLKVFSPIFFPGEEVAIMKQFRGRLDTFGSRDDIIPIGNVLEMMVVKVVLENLMKTTGKSWWSSTL